MSHVDLGPDYDLRESRFTPSRADCPHPEWWHARDDESAEEEVSELVAGFVRALQPDVVIETGTAWGQTARAIGRALKRNGHGQLVTSEPDPQRARSAELATRNLPVTVVRMPSLSVAPPGPVGFAWFDSLLELRVAEFHFLRPHLETGAIVGFHDCGPQHGLRPGVEELAAAGFIRPIYLRTPRGVIFAEVL